MLPLDGPSTHHSEGSAFCSTSWGRQGYSSVTSSGRGEGDGRKGGGEETEEESKEETKKMGDRGEEETEEETEQILCVYVCSVYVCVCLTSHLS